MRLLKSSGIFILILLSWFTVCKLELVSSYLLPSPLKVFGTIVKLAVNGKLFEHISISISRVFKGFGLTVIIAIPLAVLFHFIKSIRLLFDPLLNFLRSVPPLATIPLLILWFGIGEGSKLAIIILASFFPVFLNSLSGLDSVDNKLIEMGSTIKLSRFNKVIHILIPESLPVIITGLTLGFGYSWRALIGAEMIAASKGIGYMILDAEELAKTDVVFAGIIAIGVIGLVLDILAKQLVRRFLPWTEVVNV